MELVYLLAAIAALYGLHRLCLRLEDRGYIYYRRKRPTGSSAGCLLELQQALEPQTKHVIQVKDEKHLRSSDDPKT